jgi:hypothetical protein
LLDRGQHFTEHRAPLFAGEPRRIVPTAHLGLEGGVRPLVMAVRREADASRIRAAEAGEVGAEIEDCHGRVSLFCIS